MRLFSDIKISDNILIALIPLFGYISAFFYEVGKFYVLKVPIEYVQINIELILLSSFLTFLTSLLVIIIILILGKIPKTNDNKRSEYILKGNKVNKASFLESTIITLFIPIGVAIVLSLATILPVLYVAVISIGLLILFAGLLFLPPLAKYPDEKNYRTKFEKYSEDEYKRKVKMAKVEMKKKGGKTNIIDLFSLFGIEKENQLYGYIKITIFSIIWGLLAFILGADSMTTSIYSTTNINNKDYIVLGTYSDKFMLVGIDKDKKITTNEILLTNKEEEIRLIRDNIGKINERKSKF